VEGSLICRLQPLVHWEFMGLRTLRFRNYDDDTQKSQAAVQNAAEFLATVPPHMRVGSSIVMTMQIDGEQL
jgi:hypothetical protein